MPGYTDDPFGEKLFGTADWAKFAVWNSLPVLHRQQDEDRGGPLRKLMQCFEDELQEIRVGVEGLPSQRDPLECRAGLGDRVYRIYSISSELAPAGLVEVRLSIDGSPVSHDFRPGQTISFAGTNSSPSVTGLHTVHSLPIITGPGGGPIEDLSAFRIVGNVPPAGAGSYGICKRKGPGATIAMVKSFGFYSGTFDDEDIGSKRLINFVIEAGTYLEDLGVGYTALVEIPKPLVSPAGVPIPENSFKKPDVYSYRVERIRRRHNTSSDSLEVLCSGWVLPSDASNPISAIDPSYTVMAGNGDSVVIPLVLRFVRPPTIGALTGDFGITFDENDPEFFQRSTVQNVVKFLERKSSEKAYKIRGDTVGFNIDAKGTYALCEDIEGIPPISKVKIGDTWYTSVDPIIAHFDDIAADVTFIDPGDNVEYGPMDMYMFKDESDNKESPALTWSKCVESCVIQSSTGPVDGSPFSNEYLSSIGLATGQLVRVNIVAEKYETFGGFSKGVFALVIGGVSHYIEREDSSFNGLWPDPTLHSFIVGSPVGTLPVEIGNACIAYAPEISDDCCYCRSYVIWIQAYALDSFKKQLKDSALVSQSHGEKINEALDRLLPRLVTEQVPIHATIGSMGLVSTVSISVPKFGVSVTSVDTGVEINIDFQNSYDVVAADVQEDDLNVPRVVIESIVEA